MGTLPPDIAAPLAAALTARWGEPVRLEPLGGERLHHRVFGAERGGRPVVVKVFGHQPRRRRRREAGIARTLAGTLPVAAFVDAGEPGDGPAWLCVERLAGEAIEPHRAGLAAAEIERLYADMGALCAGLQAFPVRRLAGVSRVDRDRRYARARDRALARGGPDASLLSAAASELAPPGPPRPARLAHGDFSGRNSLFVRGPDGARLTGLVDFEMARLADPMEDVAKAALKEFLDLPAARAAFLRAYRAARPPREDDAPWLRYHLLGLIFETVNWAAAGDPAFHAQAIRTLEALMDDDPALGLD